jgi:hypothetical protein
MQKKNVSETNVNEINLAMAKIKSLFDTGHLSESARELLECSLAVSAELFSEAIVDVVTITALIVEKREKIESAPGLTKAVVDAVKGKALIDYASEHKKNATVEELVTILEVSLGIMSDKSAHDVNVVYGPITYAMLLAFYRSKAVSSSSRAIHVKNVYIPNFLFISKKDEDLLREMQEKHGVICHKGTRHLPDFVKSSRGTILLVADENYGTEVNRLIVESIGKGAFVVCHKDLNFETEEENDLFDQAVSENPAKENSVVMIYQGRPIRKTILFPPSCMLRCYTKPDDIHVSSFMSFITQPA